MHVFLDTQIIYQHENISHFCIKVQNVDSVINPDMLFIFNHRIQFSKKQFACHDCDKKFNLAICAFDCMQEVAGCSRLHAGGRILGSY